MPGLWFCSVFVSKDYQLTMGYQTGLVYATSQARAISRLLFLPLLKLERKFIQTTLQVSICFECRQKLFGKCQGSSPNSSLPCDINGPNYRNPSPRIGCKIQCLASALPVHPLCLPHGLAGS